MATVSLVPLLVSFAVIAFVYGAVGLGGGSSYIAMMMLLGVDYRQVPVIALCLNLVVASGGLWQYGSRGHFSWRVFVPLIATSIPAAFLTAQIPIARVTFVRLLGGLLIVAGGRMLLAAKIERASALPARHAAIWVLLLIGALLGAVAGLTGIGGGIYLGPVLVLLGILGQKDASGICAGFIVVNSAAGLAGRLAMAPTISWVVLIPPIAVALVFGQSGAYLGARRWRAPTVQMVFGAVVLLVALRLLVM